MNSNENRVEIIRKKMNEIFNIIADENYRNNFYVHLYGVANFAALLAARRGLEVELAYIAGLMHDIALLTSDKDYKNHCSKGSLLAREIMEGIDIFSKTDIRIVESAIFHHNDIDEYSDSMYDELLKDADVLHPFINDIPEPAWQPAKPRLEKIMTELNIPVNIIK